MNAKKKKKGVAKTYCSWNEETREQIPEAKEEGHDNGSNLVAWSQSHKHHSIQSEVHKAHEHVIIEPQELPQIPFESNHGVKKKTIKKCLDPNVNGFHQNLSKSIR